MKTFKFVVATKRSESEKDSLPIMSFIRGVNHDDIKVDVKIFFNNSRGLSEVYNEVLNETECADYTVFVHDDLWINDYLVYDKLQDSSKYFDVIGICGGKTWDTDSIDTNHPINWCVASRRSGINGFMIHALDVNKNSKKHTMSYMNSTLFATSYGETPSRTLTIDGSFICFTKKAVEAGLRFDSQFKFHFYDMDVSLSAFVKKLSVGVSPILATHESIGDSQSQPEFLESQKKFLLKWFDCSEKM